MAKFITRTISSTQIVLGELNLETKELEVIGKIVEEGKIDQEKAIKISRKAFPDRQVIVLDLVHDDAKYKISVEDFINVAEKVEDEETPAENQEAELEIPVA